MGAVRGRVSRESEGHAGVSPVEFRSLHQPLASIRRIGAESYQLVGSLHQVQVATHGRLRQCAGPAERGLVRLLAESRRHEFHQFSEVGKPRDLRQVGQVMFDIGAEVRVEPDRAVGRCPQVHCRSRKTAAPSCCAPVHPRSPAVVQKIEPVPVCCAEQVAPGARGPLAALFAAGHRPEVEITRAAGERLRNAPHEQQVRRTREQESARRPPPVDLRFHGEEQSRLALHFVQGDRKPSPEQRVGLVPGPSRGLEVVERLEASSSRWQVLREGRLSRSAGPRSGRWPA